MLLIFSGCQSSKKVKKNYEQQIDVLFNALKEGDTELFKSVLSKNALNNDDLELGINYCYELLGNKQFTVEKLGCPEYDEFDSGKRKKRIDGAYIIKVDNKKYFVDFSYWVINDFDKNSLGIDTLKISEHIINTDGSSKEYMSVMDYNRSGVYNPKWDK